MSILCLAKMSSYSTRMISTACFPVFVSSVSVQSIRSWNFICDSALYFGFSISFCCSSRSSLRIRVSIGVWFSVLSAFWVSETKKHCSADLVCSENLGEVSSQNRVTFRNQIETCRVHWYNDLGLLRSDYGEVSNLCVFVNWKKWFRRVGDSDCCLFVNFYWNWMEY